MPRYNPDPTKSQITIATLPKGDYTLQIGEPKAYHNDANVEKNQPERFGIRYPVTVVDGTEQGKRQFVNFDYNNEWGAAFGKQFLMAAFGYTNDEPSELKFNSDFASRSPDAWEFDSDTGSVGDVYRELVGKHIIATADINISKDGSGRQFQQWSNFRPIS